MKIHLAEKNVGGMTKQEIDRFLGGSKMILRLGTIDEEGAPIIHPVWYHYTSDRIYLFTGKNSRKLRNLKSNNRVYFTVDTDATPHKGVRGKGMARVIADSDKTKQFSEKIVRKYMDESSPGFKQMLDYARSGAGVVVEITPKYYTVWDYSRTSV